MGVGEGTVFTAQGATIGQVYLDVDGRRMIAVLDGRDPVEVKKQFGGRINMFHIQDHKRQRKYLDYKDIIHL